LLNYSINIEDFYLISKLHYDSDLIPHAQIKGKARMENQSWTTVKIELTSFLSRRLVAFTTKQIED